MLNLKGYLQPDACRTLSEENREYRPKQRMNVGRMERIWWLERGFGKMSKRPKPFEYKGEKTTRHPRESLWRDGLSFSKWWRARELNPRPLRCERSALPTELAPHTQFVSYNQAFRLGQLAGDVNDYTLLHRQLHPCATIRPIFSTHRIPIHTGLRV